MRNAIREYLELKENEKQNLWENATFVFDTNVFLNLYRYSPKTREQLVNAFEQLSDRVWMPYQVAYEFSKNRCEIIYEANERFQRLKSDADKMINSWKEELRADSSDEDVKELDEYLQQWIEKKEAKNRLITNPNEDSVLDKLLELFDGKVGQAFSKDEIANIEQEGEKRYANSVPPGYKDKKKVENKYGDLFVWKEILRFAKDNKKDIIFVIHDQKEDWWNQLHGKTIGPRVELRKEFYEQTNQKFHMYSMSSFLSTFGKHIGETIDTETIDEVELFSYVLKQKAYKEELNQYYENFDDEKEKRAAQIRFEIARLENKNRKRENVIANLYTENGKRPLKNKKRQYLENNEINLEKDKRKIERLLDELAML